MLSLDGYFIKVLILHPRDKKPSAKENIQPTFGKADNESQKVGFIHLIQKMHGIFALVVTVDDDIKYISVFRLYRDELFAARPVASDSAAVRLSCPFSAQNPHDIFLRHE